MYNYCGYSFWCENDEISSMLCKMWSELGLNHNKNHDDLDKMKVIKKWVSQIYSSAYQEGAKDKEEELAEFEGLLVK